MEQQLSIIREHLDRFRAVTLQTLDLFTNEQADHRPAAGLKTVAEQFLHIAQVEEYYRRGLFEDTWDFAAFAPFAERLDLALVRRRLDSVRAALLANLDALEEGDLETVHQAPGIPIEWSLSAWLWYILEHEVHHKAQLALCLRLLGTTPPFFAAPLPPGIRPDIGFGKQSGEV